MGAVPGLFPTASSDIAGVPVASDELVFRVVGSAATAAEPISLAAAGLREREHLQEWVLANPEILGPDVIVVTSEFDRWVSRSGREPDRLDVLGLDSDGRLVVAELKRDRAPDFVTMQAINYASRASRFDLDELAEAFLSFRRHADDGPATSDEALAALRAHAPSLSAESIRNPRIVLVAGDFPAAVTSSVVWLSERDLDITLVQVRAYRWGEEHAVTVSRLWPVPDVEDYVVAPAKKERATAALAIPAKEWSADDLAALAASGVSPTILTTMDLCAASPATWIGGDQVIAVTGRDPNAHRGDYGGFAIVLRRRFDRSNPPFEMEYGAGEIYQQYYRLEPALAECWRGLRGLDATAQG